jgi:(2R)-ethylmalonyl-CoA mutase
VAAVFTPKDFGITAIIGRIVEEIRLARKLQPRSASHAVAAQPASAATIEG